MKKLIGPFKQIITMDHLPLDGPIEDSELQLIPNGGILIQEDIIIEVGDFEVMYKPDWPSAAVST